MTTTRRSALALAALAGAVASAGAPDTAAAQQTTVLRAAAPAWLGVGYHVRWIENDGACRSQVVVESVIDGAPAQRAGVRPGDAILALNGRPVLGDDLGRLATRLRPGDSLRLDIERNGARRQLLAVAERRPDRPPSTVLAPRDDFMPAGRFPMVRLSGDTLIAENLELAPGFSGDGSALTYWYVADDGRRLFRRVTGRSRGELDGRVFRLASCVDSLRVAVGPSVFGGGFGGAGYTVETIQARRDSLREVYVESVRRGDWARGDGDREVRVYQFPGGLRPGDPMPPADVQVWSDPGGSGSVYRFDTHVVLSERGVAGAELFRLEGELADYFRGVRDGLLVLSVAPDSPADRAGLRAGDVITRAGRRQVRSTDELRRLLSLPEPEGLELTVVRHGRDRTLTLPRR